VLVRSARLSDHARPTLVLRLHRQRSGGQHRRTPRGGRRAGADTRVRAHAAQGPRIRSASIRTRSPNSRKRASAASPCAR
jgi:hypothetical protein